jgi:hypothetical protein
VPPGTTVVAQQLSLPAGPHVAGDPAQLGGVTHAPAAHTGVSPAHAAVLCHVPFASQLCGWFPTHRLSMGTQDGPPLVELLEVLTDELLVDELELDALLADACDELVLDDALIPPVPPVAWKSPTRSAHDGEIATNAARSSRARTGRWLIGRPPPRRRNGR